MQDALVLARCHKQRDRSMTRILRVKTKTASKSPGADSMRVKYRLEASSLVVLTVVIPPPLDWLGLKELCGCISWASMFCKIRMEMMKARPPPRLRFRSGWC